MNTSNLKEYIRKLYQLESILYNQDAFRQRIIYQINKLEDWKEEPIIIHHDEVTFWEKAKLVLQMTGSGAMLGALIGWVIAVIKITSYTKGFKTGLIIGALIGFLGTILLWYILSLDSKKEDQSIQKENENIIERNKKNRQFINRKIDILKQELYKLDASYSQTQNILNMYYSKNIIYRKYRDIVAISSFYEYLESGRCTCLEGHEGAYNIYENELMQKIIISKLDDIIDRLDIIQRNQYKLYSAISDSNKKAKQLSCELERTANSLQNIETNSALTAYNTELLARNTEFLSWIEYWRL